MKLIKKLLIPMLVVVPLLAVTVLTVYLSAYREYGSPTEYRAQQEQLIQARMDSVRMRQNILTPETLGDSVMVNVGDQGTLFEENREDLDHISQLQMTLDSLRTERAAIEEKEASVTAREESLKLGLDAETDAKISALAEIYNNMKAPQAAPLIIGMNDTLAVRIIARLDKDNAADLLADIAETDINKAMRLNSLLAEMGVNR